MFKDAIPEKAAAKASKGSELGTSAAGDSETGVWPAAGCGATGLAATSGSAVSGVRAWRPPRLLPRPCVCLCSAASTAGLLAALVGGRFSASGAAIGCSSAGEPRAGDGVAACF